MVKKHLKSLPAPKSWPIKRLGIDFTTRPNPGPHSLESCMPLNIILRDILGIAKSRHEVRRILQEKTILVDGVRRKDIKFPVGILDLLEIKETQQYFRVILNEKKKIELIPIDKNEANIKPCKIIGKTKVRGKIQINLYDGKNILVDTDEYTTGGSLILSIPGHEITDYIKLEKGSFVYLMGGKHSGEIGRVEDILEDKITYKRKTGEVVETLRKYVFVIGKEKPVVSLTKKE